MFTETVKAAKNQTKLAFIGLGIAIVVLVSCCIFFAWRRRRRSQQPDRAVYHSPPSQEPQAAIVTQTKAPDYGTGPPGGAPPPYSATMAQPPYQGIIASTVFCNNFCINTNHCFFQLVDDRCIYTKVQYQNMAEFRFT